MNTQSYIRVHRYLAVAAIIVCQPMWKCVADSSTNDVVIVSITISNNVATLQSEGPPSAFLVVDSSIDLIDWNPHHVFSLDNGITGRVAFAANSLGIASIECGIGSDFGHRFFRVIRIQPEPEWPPPLVPFYTSDYEVNNGEEKKPNQPMQPTGDTRAGDFEEGEP